MMYMHIVASASPSECKVCVWLIPYLVWPRTTLNPVVEEEAYCKLIYYDSLNNVERVKYFLATYSCQLEF